jgi:hypothetical protein
MEVADPWDLGVFRAIKAGRQEGHYSQWKFADEQNRNW